MARTDPATVLWTFLGKSPTLRSPDGSERPAFAQPEAKELQDLTTYLTMVDSQIQRGLLEPCDRLHRIRECCSRGREIGAAYPPFGDRWIGSEWYWQLLWIPATYWSREFFQMASSSLPWHILPARTPWKCPRCKQALYVRSRTEAFALYRSRTAPRGRVCWRCDRHRSASGDDRARAVASMSYDQYMRSPFWDEIRQAMLAKAGYRCQMCKRKSRRLYVRHRSYDRVKHEQPDDLVVLCGRCNYAWHQREQGPPLPEGVEFPQVVTPPNMPQARPRPGIHYPWETAFTASTRPDLERLIGQVLQDAGEDLA